MLKNINIPIIPNKNIPLDGDIITLDNINTLTYDQIQINSNIDLIIGKAINDDEWEQVSSNKYTITYRKKYKKDNNFNYKNISFINYSLTTIDSSWYEIFINSYSTLSLISNGLYNAVNIEKEVIVPSLKDLLNPFNYCSFNDIKVIILDKEPYPWIENDTPVTNGLAFSTKKNCTMNNTTTRIYKELERCYLNTDTPFNPPNHGDLSSWAKQGVLLLNTTMTTIGKILYHYNNKNIEKEPHKHRWSSFIHMILAAVTNYHKNLIIVTWGQEMQKQIQILGIIGKHTILKAGHPNGYGGNSDKFYGSNHFIKINDILKNNKKQTINWHTVMDNK